MPAPSPLEKHTAIVERLIKEEAYLVKEYEAADGRIKKAQNADETLEGNKDAVVHQYEQEKCDTINVYLGAKGHPGIFQRIEEALEKLRDEIEKVGGTKSGREVVEKAEGLIKGGERLKVEEK